MVGNIGFLTISNAKIYWEILIRNMRMLSLINQLKDYD